MTRRPLLTEQDIVDRADRRTESGEFYYAVTALVAVCVLLVALFLPVHTWLHAHLELLFGFLLGTLAQSVPWLVDRWHWLKWFSHQ